MTDTTYTDHFDHFAEKVFSAKEGRVVDLTMDEYLAHPALSRSDLEKIRITPAHFKYFLENKEPTTPAQQLGQAFHALVLGGFDDDYVVWTGGDRRSKAYKEFKMDYADKVILTEAEFEPLLKMRTSVMTHPLASTLVDRATKEQSIEFKKDGVPCKARIDGFTEGIAFDLKTVADITNIERAILNYGYHRQAAWYLDALSAAGYERMNQFVFIFVEKGAPHTVRVVEISREFLDLGWKGNENALDVYKICKKDDIWPSWPEDIETIECPAWAHESEF